MPGMSGTASVVGGRILLRIGVGRMPREFAAFAIGFISYVWLTPDTETANAGSRAEAPHPFSFGNDRSEAGRSVHRGSDVSGSLSRSWRAQTGHVSEFVFKEPDTPSEPSSAHSSFGERFSFDLPSAPQLVLRPSQRSGSLDDRFGDLIAADSRLHPRLRRAQQPRVAARAPVPRPARLVPPKRSSEPRFRLASASDTSVSLAYAPSDPVKSSAITGSALKELEAEGFGPTRRHRYQPHRDLRHNISYGVSAERTAA